MAQLIVLFFAIGLHEYAHCKFADLAGDPTPRYYGRVTLNLFKHFDVFGSVMIFLTLLTGFGIGWGKPSPADPRKMRNPRWDFFVSVAAGPVSNLVQATFYALMLRVVARSGFDQTLGADPTGAIVLLILQYGVLINLGLCLFNLIPFGPLDGHWLLGLLLPERQRVAWFRFNSQVGTMGIFVAIILMQQEHINLLVGPILSGYRLLTGQSFIPYV